MFTCIGTLQAGEDPFGDQRKEKRARVGSQEGRQLKNKQASDKIHGKPVLPPTLKLAASLPEHGKGAPTKRRELKADVRLPVTCAVLCEQLVQFWLPAQQYRYSCLFLRTTRWGSSGANVCVCL